MVQCHCSSSPNTMLWKWASEFWAVILFPKPLVAMLSLALKLTSERGADLVVEVFERALGSTVKLGPGFLVSLPVCYRRDSVKPVFTFRLAEETFLEFFRRTSF